MQEANQRVDAFWELGIGNWEWEIPSFYKYEMLPQQILLDSRLLAGAG